jgi:uncharacterized protein YndB with AHSA1/START domain
MIAAVVIDKPREEVFDFIVRPEAVAELFHGYGPIPGAVKSELVGDGKMCVGAIRRVSNSDGSVIEEEITELERPRRQAYRVVRGLRPPFSWVVEGGGGKWTLTYEGGTVVEWRFVFEVRPLALPLALLLRPYFLKAMQDALDRAKAILDGGLRSNQIAIS